MSITSALFSPTTIVDQKTYWKGAGLLIILGALISAIPLFFLSGEIRDSDILIMLGPSVILFLLIYPWFFS